MREPYHTPPYQTGFYFFWKWHYFLRSEYIKFCEENDDSISVEYFIYNYEEDDKYKMTSDQILKYYTDHHLRAENILCFVPKWFRLGYNVVDIQYEDNILQFIINTKEIDIERHKKSIMLEVEGMLDQIKAEQRGEGKVPEKPVSIGHEKYWRRAASREVTNLKLSFLPRAIGLWLWDYSIKYDDDIVTMMDVLFDHHPKIREIEGYKSEEREQKRNEEIHYEYDKYRKYLGQTHKSIKNIDVLPL